jgi:hypothetical protein
VPARGVACRLVVPVALLEELGDALREYLEHGGDITPGEAGPLQAPGSVERLRGPPGRQGRPVGCLEKPAT